LSPHLEALTSTWEKSKVNTTPIGVLRLYPSKVTLLRVTQPKWTSK
jgi:hypothetical protein